MRNVAVVAIFVALTMLCGCRIKVPGGSTVEIGNKQQIITGLKVTGKVGTYLGLKEWAKKDINNAKACATVLVANTSEVVKYLESGKLDVSTIVKDNINSLLFKNISPEVKSAIVLAAIALDAYLKVPAVDSYLNTDQIDYLKAFMVGVSNGSQQFLDSVNSKDMQPAHGKWLE